MKRWCVLAWMAVAAFPVLAEYQELESIVAVVDEDVAGEMMDWEAPTGGYLLQACFSTAVAAGSAHDELFTVVAAHIADDQAAESVYEALKDAEATGGLGIEGVLVVTDFAPAFGAGSGGRRISSVAHKVHTHGWWDRWRHPARSPTGATSGTAGPATGRPCSTRSCCRSLCTRRSSGVWCRGLCWSRGGTSARPSTWAWRRFRLVIRFA